LPFAGFARAGESVYFQWQPCCPPIGAIWLGRRSVFTAPALPVKVRLLAVHHVQHIGKPRKRVRSFIRFLRCLLGNMAEEN
jgi:hypothetical protein